MKTKIFKDIQKKEKLYLLSASVLFVLRNLAGVVLVLAVLKMINEIADRSINNNQLINYWYFIGGAILLRAACDCIADLFEHYAGFRLSKRIRTDVLLKLKKFSLGFFSEERIGELGSIIHKDVSNIEHVVGHLWTRISADIISSLIIGFALFIFDWKLGLAMIAFLPVGLYILIKGTGKTEKINKKTQNKIADMASLFVEYTKGIPVLKAFYENPDFMKKINKSVEDLSEDSYKTANTTARITGGYFLFIELSYLLIVVIGAMLVWNKQIEIYHYLVFIVISLEFYKPFLQADKHWLLFIVARDSYARISKIADHQEVKDEGCNSFPANSNIHFTGAGFSYKDSGFTLNNLSLHIEENSLVALVGPSGSGKSTISNLLLRFWDIDKGAINIGGVEIRDIKYNDLLANITIVMQNVILMSDTILENIKMGNKHATREQVIGAAKKAMIHDFIMTLPHKYDTMLGENGAGLSGGQKQRISIARALIKDTPILILDEATSNVDPINERYIQKAISNLAQDRTVIVVAHHLSTIKNADQIVVLNKGEIVEKGRHDELLGNGRLYSELWNAQEKTKHIRIGKPHETDLVFC